MALPHSRTPSCRVCRSRDLRSPSRRRSPPSAPARRRHQPRPRLPGLPTPAPTRRVPAPPRRPRRRVTRHARRSRAFPALPARPIRHRARTTASSRPSHLARWALQDAPHRQSSPLRDPARCTQQGHAARARAARVPVNAGYGGQQVGPRRVVRWERRDNRILLRNVSYETVADSTTADRPRRPQLQLRPHHRRLQRRRLRCRQRRRDRRDAPVHGAADRDRAGEPVPRRAGPDAVVHREGPRLPDQRRGRGRR